MAFPRFGLAVIALLTLASCGGGTGTGGPTTLPGGDIQLGTGTAQKGPFLAGATVTLNTLTDRTIAYTAATQRPFLAPSGRSFTLETDSLGRFDASGIVLSTASTSPEQFVEAHVEGYFFDEINGQRSGETIALRAVIDTTKQKPNINVLTDLSRARTLKLAREQLAGCTTTGTTTAANTGANCIVTSAEFGAARAQAEREVLAAFNIPVQQLGSYTSFSDLNIRNIASATSLFDKVAPADQALLAISALVVQIGRDGAGITEFINAFEADLAADGKLDDADLRAQISRASAVVDFGAVARNMNVFYKTTQYMPADLQKWVDPTGGVNGVVAANSEYFDVSTGASTASYTSSTRNFTSLGANGSCVLLTNSDGTSLGTSPAPAGSAATPQQANDGAIQFVNATVGGAPASAGAGLPDRLYVPKDGVLSFQVRITGATINSRARVLAWDASAPDATGCSTGGQPGLVGVHFFAAMPADLVQFTSRYLADFAKCFNLPVTTRIRATDLRNPDIPEVTELHELCRPLADSSYLNNGYRVGQDHYNILSDASMTKTARVVRVDVEDYRAGPGGKGVAEIGIIATDRYNRQTGWRITATRAANATSASPAGGWSNTGNQDPVDITLAVGARRFTSIPLQTVTWVNGVPNTVDRKLTDLKVAYQTAFLPTINNDGPGVVRADGARLTAVLIQGPGLVSGGVNGVVYVPPLQRGQQAFDFSNHNTMLPDGRPQNQLPRCGFTPAMQADGSWPAVPANCPLNWVGASAWAAPTLGSSNNLTTLTYPAPTAAATQPTGGVWLATNTGALMTQGTGYQFKLFYGNEATPTHTIYKRLRTTLPSLATLHAMDWVKLDMVGSTSLQGLVGSASTAAANPFEALRPVAGTTTLDVSWTGQVMNRTEIFGANTNLQRDHYPRCTPGDTVARGLAYVTLAPQLDQDGIPLEMQWSSARTAVGAPITTPNDLSLGLSQVISLQHRTWDGSWKSQDFLIETARR
jgi:hypothetical protein